MNTPESLMQCFELQLAQIWDTVLHTRQYLHAHPEKSNEERGTAEFIARVLNDAGISFRTHVGGYGIVADIGCEDNRPSILLRADMDALAVQENTGVSYSSQYQGLMHACGHDVHMSALLAVALIVQRYKESLPCGVRFIFQPAEENGPIGGAQPMIADGALEGANIQAVFAAHVIPQIACGRISVTEGTVIAANDNFIATIKGRGGHAAMPHLAINPLIPASELLLSLFALPTQAIPANHTAVLTVSCLNGGTRRNVIPETATLQGTMRTFDSEDRETLTRRINEVASGIAKSSGAEVDFRWYPSYTMGTNNLQMVRFLRKSILKELGADYYESSPPPIIVSEDFAYFLQERPGAMFWVGAATEEGENQQLHSPTFLPPEETLRSLCRAFLAIISNYQPD